MAATRVARPPAGSISPPVISLGVLPRRQLTGLIPALLAIGAATAVTGLNTVRPFTDLLPLIWTCAIVLAGLSLAAGIRAFQRAGRVDPAIEAVLPVLGASQPTRALVEVQKWTRGWVGVPARIKIRYAKHVNDLDPRFLELILGAFARRIGEEYRVRKHNMRRCILMLEIAPAADPVTREQQRAHDVIKQVLHPTATIQVSSAADGTVSMIEVKHNVGPRMAVVARRMQIEKVISSMLPGRWRARWDLEGDKVVFEVRPEMPDMVLHEVEGEPGRLSHAAYKTFKIPIGPDEDGTVQYWQPSVSPHCLVIGGTGSGKTSFQHTVLTHLAHARWRVWVLDGKRIEFAGFRDWPNVELVGARVEHQVRMLHAAHELMEERYTQLENNTARLEDFDPLVLIIDEYATFKARVERWYKTVKPKGAPPKAPVLDLLSDLARLARSAKIHMLLGLQRPDVEFLGGEMRDNFGARVSFGRLSPQGANMMWDSFAIGVAIPRNKRGRGVTLNAESQPVEIQAYYTPDPAKLDSSDVADWAQIERLRPKAEDYGRVMVREPDSDLDGRDEEIPPDYYEWASARIVPWTKSAADAGTAPAASSTIRAAASAGVRFVPTDVDDQDGAGIADMDSDGYGAAVEGPAVELEIGDLLQTDFALELWGVVEGVEPDVVDEDQLAIEYRDLETGEEGLLTISDNEVVTYRRPEDA
ncbi:FtsK/SpoIIIE domain-containing protein [Micromonospora sp. DT81.3]|uniref:FtsK/SpoIIIE domain-containing protein n=1 Tax=Micromonospora sp. DT81.3 TaxID=3416523 RepID=UPI003CEA9F97